MTALASLRKLLDNGISINVFCVCSYSKDANHLDFCGILLIFKADFRITILTVKITAKNDLKMVPDKITGVTPTSTPVIPVPGCKIKYRLICA